MAGLTGRSEDGKGRRASYNRPGLQHKGGFTKWDELEQRNKRPVDQASLNGIPQKKKRIKNRVW